MHVRRYDDPAAFRRDAASILMAAPGRSSLPLAVLQTLVTEPEIYPVFHLWMAMEQDTPAGLAMQTEPYNVILADPLQAASVRALADAVLAGGNDVPGTIGNTPFVQEFAEHVARGSGRRAEITVREGVWELELVNDVASTAGSARPAVGRDRDLIRGWLEEFFHEALPDDHPRDDVRTEALLDLRLSGKGGGYWLWDDGEPVSLAGHLDVPRVGSRIGPVYTPPRHRGRGYATRLVAELSAARLALGDPACFLFTDLANPTSNAIYERIGYVKICDAEEYSFRT
jgi:uncharacterized protein